MICLAQSVFTCLWGEWGGLTGECLYCALRQLYGSEALLGSRIVAPFVVCWNAVFLQGCMKKGHSGGFATCACRWSPGKASLVPKALRHPGCICPACRAGPRTHLPACRHPGLGGWAQTALGAIGPLSVQLELSALADAECGPFFPQKSSCSVF